MLDVEPTRALGHKLKKEHPLHHPETQEWAVPDVKNTILMLSCDGFFSKEAFGSPDHVTRFLSDPQKYCKDPNLFKGTCLKVSLVLRQCDDIYICMYVCMCICVCNKPQFVVFQCKK